MSIRMAWWETRIDWLQKEIPQWEDTCEFFVHCSKLNVENMFLHVMHGTRLFLLLMKYSGVK